jgi:hypothetical protein
VTVETPAPPALSFLESALERERLPGGSRLFVSFPAFSNQQLAFGHSG